jgi:hypothetical protein
MLGRDEEARSVLVLEKELITSHRDGQRLKRLRALERREGLTSSPGGIAAAVTAHLRLADRAQRAANTHDALEHYRAARVLLEVLPSKVPKRT